MAKLWVNYICLIGVAIGIISLLCSWAYFDYSRFPLAIFSVVPDIMPPALFLIGTIVAFITPLGGILQFVSSIDFIFTWQSHFSQGYNVSIFPIIGLLSSVIILYSMRSPSWISRDDRTFPRTRDKISIMRRLLTFSLIDEKAATEPLP